ncbi:MAG: twin-arginine translocase subunit TatC [Bacteroidota bacterium]
MAQPDQAVTFLGHLADLRRCLIRAALALIVGFGASIFLSGRLLEFIRAGRELVVLRPAEALMGQLKIALVNGIVISFPVILWQIGAFIWPALYRDERRALLLYLPFALILFLLGVGFGFLVLVRSGYQFLLSLVPEGMRAYISLDSYLSFILSSTLACGLVFLLPVVVLFLARLGVLKAAFLWRQQRLVIIGLAILVAIITPTVDMVSMILVFLPLFGLFELSILLAWLAERRRARRLEARTSG